MATTAFVALPQLSARTPFRLGVTSYVYPADILPNVEALAPLVDDVELVFFESAQTSNVPSPETMRRLAALGAEHDLTYTVHFPIDRHLGSESSAEREALLTQMRRLIERTRPLHPYAYLLHAEGVGPGAARDVVLRWQDRVRPSLAALRESVAPPQLLCLENLDYPFAWCDPFLDEFGLAVCTDFGHLWQSGQDWKAHWERYGARTRVVHLYGVSSGTAHGSLTLSPPALVRDVLDRLAAFSGVLTLETFEYEDTKSSLERLNECLSAYRHKFAHVSVCGSAGGFALPMRGFGRARRPCRAEKCVTELMTPCTKQPQRRLMLVLGGARSGKSRYSQRLAETWWTHPLYVATAEALDEEMKARIELHRRRRGTRWHCLEEPLDLAEAIRSGVRECDGVLVDCLTIWLSNVLLKEGAPGVETRKHSLLDALCDLGRDVILVSNEVGMGVVPDTPLGREFRDLQGWLNQELAAAADTVVFVTAGLPMALKGSLP